MEFFNPKSNVNFMGIRRITVGIALFLIAASIISLATRGLNFALDFTGGTLVEVLYEAPVEQSEVSRNLEAAGVEGAIVQRFSSTNFSIRLSPEAVEKLGAAVDDLGESSLDGRNAAVGQKILEALNAGGHSVEIKRSEFVCGAGRHPDLHRVAL
jgi:preprotein translocase subunit SecF